MGEYAQFITHKGKRILFVSGAGLAEAECLAALEELKQAMLKEGAGVLVLADISRWRMTKHIIDKAKDLAAAGKAAGIQERPNAIVGLTGLQKSVAQLFSPRSTQLFDSVDQAKEWLVQEDDKRQRS